MEVFFLFGKFIVNFFFKGNVFIRRKCLFKFYFLNIFDYKNRKIIIDFIELEIYGIRLEIYIFNK